jgi:hypothetical protein
VTSPLRTLLAPLALAVALVPFAAGPADAASKHRRHATKHAAAKVKAKRAVVTPAPVATPAPAATTAAPAVNSVISIGGYVFYNLTYAEAVAAYQAAVAAAPPGYTPAPVTSISVSTTVGGTAL